MRLEITRRADLASRALLLLARDGGRVKSADLAAALDTTAGFVPQILGPLVERGWIAPVPGPTGGPSLDGLARHWMDVDRHVSLRHVTIAGFDAAFAHETAVDDHERSERYLAVIDGPRGLVIATVDGTNVTPASLQREWLAFVASIHRT